MVNDLQETAKFWNDHFLKKKRKGHDLVVIPKGNDPVLLRALEHFGDVKDKKLIDLGCGRGGASLFFAEHGAKVISLDFSEVAIENLKLDDFLYRFSVLRKYSYRQYLCLNG